MPNAYQGLHQQYEVLSETNVMTSAHYGVRLATDNYFPAANGRKVDESFSVILERTPYNKATPGHEIRQANCNTLTPKPHTLKPYTPDPEQQ